MKLPNGERAVIPLEKLRDYALNPFTTDRGAKARIFRAALGLTRDDVDVLRELLLMQARTESATLGRRDVFGQRYIIDAGIGAFERTVVLRSVWIVHETDGIPHLLTCCPLRRKDSHRE